MGWNLDDKVHQCAWVVCLLHVLCKAVYMVVNSHNALASFIPWCFKPQQSKTEVVLAAWLGWRLQVMYIPQAKQLTHGGFFYQNEEGSWDTPESAKLVLQYFLSANYERVSTETSPRSGRTLESLIEGAMESSEATEVIDLFLEVKETVASARNAMVRPNSCPRDLQDAAVA